MSNVITSLRIYKRNTKYNNECQQINVQLQRDDKTRRRLPLHVVVDVGVVLVVGVTLVVVVDVVLSTEKYNTFSIYRNFVVISEYIL